MLSILYTFSIDFVLAKESVPVDSGITIIQEMDRSLKIYIKPLAVFAVKSMLIFTSKPFVSVVLIVQLGIIKPSTEGPPECIGYV